MKEAAFFDLELGPELGWSSSFLEKNLRFRTNRQAGGILQGKI